MAKTIGYKISNPLAYSIRQAAQLIQVHENTVRMMLRTGKLSGVRIGSLWRIPRREMLRVCGESARAKDRKRGRGN